MPSPPFLSRVKVRNYKSLANCNVELGRLTLLVGRNGCGKSNFLDAIRFVLDGLQTSLDHAVKSRGGIDEVRRKSTGHPHNFAISLKINLEEGFAWYGFEIAARPRGGFVVKDERLKIFDTRSLQRDHFHVTEGKVVSSSLENMAPGVADRLYLVTAAGRLELLEVYESLMGMGFYNLNPEEMKDVQSPDAGELLRRDGSNIASVVARLESDRPALKARIRTFLSAIVPDVADFERTAVGHKETLLFRQAVRGSQHPWRFHAASMSDGTLRALGVLIAAMQLVDRKDPVHLVGIEEPEAALHPAAVAALMESLREAAVHTQVLVTTHSPDILDQFDETKDTLLVLQSKRGETEIAPADNASRQAIHDHLYSAGELLRMDQLQPDQQTIERQQNMSSIWEQAEELA